MTLFLINEFVSSWTKTQFLSCLSYVQECADAVYKWSYLLPHKMILNALQGTLLSRVT